MKLIATNDGKSIDLTELAGAITWAGDTRQLARELSFSVPVTQIADFPQIDLPLFSGIAYYDDNGEPLFIGHIVYRRRNSREATMDFRCLDRGRYLAGNVASYRFNATPEAATATICKDFGIETDCLAVTGIALKRKFSGEALHEIVRDLYARAAEQNGKSYYQRFTGAGKFTVRERTDTPVAKLGTGNGVLASSITEDGSRVVTSVKVLDEDGKTLKTIRDAEREAVAGVLSAAVRQSRGTDDGKRAQRMLDDGAVQQDVTVDVLGDVRLVTGEAVYLTDTVTGITGLFWIDADTHVWSNGIYRTNLTLNFKKLVNDTDIGEE